MKKLVLKIDGMHCTSCVMNIDGELEDTDGVNKASTSYAKQRTEIEYDHEKITEDTIVAIIQSIGYQATVVK